LTCSKIGSSALAAALCLTLAAGPARADTGQAKAMAETLFREGKKLFAQGKIAEACEKLESSYKIDEALGTLLNLADCHEKQGRLATAWGEYSEALSIAKKAGQAPRQKFARERLAAIEPKLAHLTVQVSADAAVEGLEVTIDQVPLVRGGWGTPVPANPGEHVIAAGAPGKQRWETNLTLEPSESRSVEVPRLDPIPVAAAPAPPPPRAAWKIPVGASVAGLGVVGLTLGTYFGVRALDLGGQASKGCQPDGGCTPAAFAANQDGRKAATLSTVFVFTGGALAAAGTVVLILGLVDGPAPRPAALRVVPLVGPGAALLTAGGVF
jgi:hypothetical protein